MSLLGVVPALIAFAVYVFTLSDGAFPGRSADHIARATGLTPRLSPLNPLWGAIVDFVTGLVSIGGLASTANLFSAACGALAVFAFYRLLTLSIYAAIEPTEWNHRLRAWAAGLASLCGSLCLAFSLPLWIASNRARPESFDLLALTLLLLFAVACVRGASRPRLFLFGLACGVGIVEFPTVALFLPFMLLALAYGLLRTSNPTVSHAIAAVGGILLGLGAYAVVAVEFARTPSYGWHQYDSVFQVAWYMWRDQFRQVAYSLPSVGWLLVIVMTIVPALYAASAARRSLNEAPEWSSILAHVVLSVVAVACILNLKISPWEFVRHRGNLIVTPYLLVSGACGYLLAYWCVLPWHSFDQYAPGARRAGRATASTVLSLLCLALPAGALAKNLRVADARQAGVINRYADAIVADLGDSEWLVTDGVVDQNVLISAHDQGRSVVLLNMGQWRNNIYRRYVTSLFEDNALLRSRAEIGLVPLLREMFESDPEVLTSAKTLTGHDLWFAAELAGVPLRTVTGGAADAGAVDAAELYRSHERFWEMLVPDLLAMDADHPLLGSWSTAVRNRLSVIANNLGVFLEDASRGDDAFKAYGMAWKLNPENLSSLLNMGVMIDDGYPAEDAKVISSRLDGLLERLPNAGFWSLAGRCGYVRLPAAYAQLGWSWVESGQRGMGIAGLQKAVELRADQDKVSSGRQRGRELVAGAFLAAGDLAEAEAYYQAILDGGGNAIVAYVGLARVEARRGNHAKALDLLDAAERDGAMKTQVLLEKSVVHIGAKQLDEARTILADLVDVAPDNGQAWALLAGVLLDQGDDEALAGYMNALERIADDSPAVSLSLGRVAEARRDLTAARRRYLRALALDRRNTQALERLMALSFRDDDTEQGERYMRRLLSLNPDNALGNYGLAKTQIEREEYRLAEDSLRRSLRSSSRPRTINDLAWVLYKQGAFDEAKLYVDKAIDQRPDLPAAWDTRGLILTALREWREAEAAFKKAIEQQPNRVEFHVHLADLHVAEGDMAKARGVLRELQGRADDLSRDERAAVRRLEKALRL